MNGIITFFKCLRVDEDSELKFTISNFELWMLKLEFDKDWCH